MNPPTNKAAKAVPWTEEVLGHWEDEDAKYGPYPVTLIIWDNGKMDLHSQTGWGHIKAIEAAREILWKRGLAVGPASFEGPTGLYYPVRPTQSPKEK